VPVNALGEGWIAMSQGTPFQVMFADGFPTYPLAMFVFPFLIGSWRLVVYHYVMGPFLAALTTSNPNEIPAVWCLLSIGFLLLVVKTPLRHYMHVKRWPLWSLIPGAASSGSVPA